MRRLVVPLATLLLAPLVALGLSLGVPAPAGAAAGVRDGRDAPAPYDTQRVRLFPSYRGAVVVQMYSTTYNVGPRFNGIDVYYDTRGGRAADFRLGWQLAKDGDGITRFQFYRVNGQDTVAAVRCAGAGAKARRRIDATEIYVPRSCMTIRKRVGVRTQAWDYMRYRNGQPVRGHRDNAPNRGLLR